MFRNVCVAKLLRFCFKEITFDLYLFKYIVMLLKFYFVVVVSFNMLGPCLG